MSNRVRCLIASKERFHFGILVDHLAYDSTLFGSGGTDRSERLTRKPETMPTGSDFPGLRPKPPPSGHLTPAASPRCRYSYGARDRLSNRARSLAAPGPLKSQSKYFFYLAHRQSPRGQADPPFRGSWLPLCCPALLSLWKSFRRSRTRFLDWPETVRLHRGIGVHLYPRILFKIIPEHRSTSCRNRVHLAPDSHCRPTASAVHAGSDRVGTQIF